MPLVLIAFVLVALGGAAIALQAPINLALGRSLALPVAAAAVSFGVGFVVLAGLTLALGGVQPVLRLGQPNLWMFTGGLLGAYYVWAAIWAVPHLGIGTIALGYC